MVFAPAQEWMRAVCLRQLDPAPIGRRLEYPHHDLHHVVPGLAAALVLAPLVERRDVFFDIGVVIRMRRALGIVALAKLRLQRLIRLAVIA